LNIYNDEQKFLAKGYGIDVASQRADDLDAMAIEKVSMTPSAMAMDIACGSGGQSVRMANAGATVFATDVIDVGNSLREVKLDSGRIIFSRMRMQNLDLVHFDADVIVCQRAIHYLPYRIAVKVVSEMRRLLAPDGRLYLSASGIDSELGEGYPKRCDIKTRFAMLTDSMKAKHGIHASVCLYSSGDMERLLAESGLVCDSVFVSPFGNIKAVARHA